MTGLRNRAGGTAAKVPEVTALFWLIKIATTGMGEAASDWMGHQAIPVAAVLVALSLAALAAAMVLQFRAVHYVGWVYWSAVAMVSVVGTMVADGLKEVLGLTLLQTSVAFSLAVAGSLYLWWRAEGSLSIHSIVSRRRETFYWATVVSTFALGTAVGDLTAVTLGLGWLASGVMFTAAILVPLLAWRLLGLNAVVAFWSAYVLTRPLGASFADWAAVPVDGRGLGLGTGPVAGVLIVLIVSLVAVSSSSMRPAGFTVAPHAPELGTAG